LSKIISQQLKDPLSMFDVSGQTAVVTGASGAFGRGISITLGALGANVMLASGSEEELNGIAEEIREVGGQAETIVRRPDSLDDAEAIRDAALKKFGSIKMLAIGSGYNKAGFIHEMDYQDWQDVMDANVRGAWFMAKAIGSYWIENDVRGKVVLMSSVRGRHGNISGYTGYCTSKGATDSLTRALVAWPNPSSPYIHAVNFDLNTVGAIAFTVIPCLAHSVAKTRVRESVAPFDVQYPV
jgi:NAD(P)-dependent dehydrogenase (short-subunit alcohol dehydrogenase family)